MLSGVSVGVAPRNNSPRIVGTHLVVHGAIATGFAITFNRPMDPASVLNLANYQVSDVSPQKSKWGVVKTLVFPFKINDQQSRPVRLKSATYDAASSTLILTPVFPVSSAGQYQVAGGANSASRSPKKSEIRDISGQLLSSLKLPDARRDGSFTQTVTRRFKTLH